MTTDERPSLALTTPPAAGGPITIEEARAYLRVDGNADDTVIGVLLAGAVEEFETYTGRRLVSQAWTARWDAFPRCGALRLPLAPVAAVTHVKYLDLAAAQQTWSSALYQTDLASVPARILPLPTASWPDAGDRLSAIEVLFTVGYANQAAVPNRMKLAPLMILAARYEIREGIVAGAALANSIPLPEQALAEMRKLRVSWFGT